MHGIFNRGLQCFVQEIYGLPTWESIRQVADIKEQNFEAMLTYDDMVTEQFIEAICEVTKRARSEILEDFGTFVVSEHSSPTVLRLLRLGGEDYVEFLYSLEDLHDRVAIAVPDLDLPVLELEVHAPNRYTLWYESSKLGYGAVFLGLLRTMADVYDSLVTVTHSETVSEGIAKDRFEIEMAEHLWTDAAQLPSRLAS